MKTSEKTKAHESQTHLGTANGEVQEFSLTIGPESVEVEFDALASLDEVIDATTRADLDLALKADGIGVDLAASMRLVRLIAALHAKKPGLPPDIVHMLRLLVLGSQSISVIDLAAAFGPPIQSSVTRAALASVQVLGGKVLKPQGNVQIGERFFAQRVIDYLDLQRPRYLAADDDSVRQEIIDITCEFVFAVVGRRPSAELVRLALATPRRKRGGLTRAERQKRKADPRAAKHGQDHRVKNLLAEVGLVYASGSALRRSQFADRKK